MTSHYQRIAIAKFCGYRIEPPKDKFPYWCVWFGHQQRQHFTMRDVNHKIPTMEDLAEWDYIPNFPKNLEAMYEAEEVVLELNQQGKPEGLWDRYMRNLIKLCGNPYNAMHAKASQRADALTATIEAMS
jgi:hypothetical protein